MTAEPARNRSLLERTWWLHPLLLGAFPVLFLFTENIGEQVSIEPVLVPLALAMAGSAVVLSLAVGVARFLGAEPARGGLVASLLVALFFSYGHVWQAVEPALTRHRYLLAAWAVLTVVGLVLAARARPAHVRAATGALTVAGLFLVGFNLVPIAQFQLSSSKAPEARASAPPSVPASEPSEGPQRDVWYLVFDRYTGQDALSRLYDFDNGRFIAELEERGFVVPEHASANYLKTAHSLASTLNMDYLDTDALAAAAAEPDDWTPLYRMLQESHPVERFLHERGYEYLHLGVRRGATYTNAAADREFLYGTHTEFSAVLADTTLLAALENVLSDGEPGGYAGLYGNHTLYQFNVLEQLAEDDGARPRFVFAHFLMPHPPYVFNADGSWVTPQQTAARNGSQQYLEQLQYANARILRLLDMLRERPSDEQPIVLIQADEGPFPPRYARDEEGFAWLDATDDELLRKFSILAAYHLPGVPADELAIPETITPVNSFRLILSAAFDADLPLLPDRNLVFVDQRHLYEMVDVTDRVRRVLGAASP